MPDLALENRKYKLETGASQDLFVVHMVREESFNSLYTLTFVVVADEHVAASEIVGHDAKMWLESEAHGKTWYGGICTDCSYEGMIGQLHVYRLIVRPELWLLTQRRNHRIFQDELAMDIVDQVVRDAGIDVATRKGGEFPSTEMQGDDPHSKFEHCVQYGETDFNFVQRLMAEEGIFYYFDHKDPKPELIAGRVSSGLDQIAGDTLTFQKTETIASLDGERIFVWRSSHLVRSEKATLNDYNHQNPTADLKVSKVIENNKKSGSELELYDYPGRYRVSGRGDDLVKNRMEAFDEPTSTWEGKSNIPIMVAGRHFQMKEHPVDAFNNTSFLITHCKHVLRAEMDLIQSIISNGAMTDVFDDKEEALAGVQAQGGDAAPTGGAIDGFSCEFRAQELTTPYRPPQDTPKPIAYSTEPALVVGDEEEKPHVDEFGRIKCHFFWDRDSQKDDTSSAWIRVMQPGFADARWGQQFIPRVGQEVVVAFQRGDPDRPIVIGAMYHKDFKPPYKLPDNKSQSGIKTKSLSGAGYHELLFDDKENEEYVRLQSQKDFHFIVKNKWLTSIGYEEIDNRGIDEATHAPSDPAAATGGSVTGGGDDGDCAMKIKNNYNVEVDQGDNNFKVSTGNQNTDVATDRKTTVGGNHEETISGTQDITITGACTITSNASIELIVGASSIKLEPAKITISSTAFEVKGTASGTVDGGLSLTVKAATVNIN